MPHKTNKKQKLTNEFPKTVEVAERASKRATTTATHRPQQVNTQSQHRKKKPNYLSDK
jgi:hypothetical protein